MTSDYRPISCGAYDEIELMAMHRSVADLLIRAASGELVAVAGTVVDTAVHDNAEFVVMEIEGERREFRLDRIKRIQAGRS